jgi:hypothetical protein
LSGFKVVYLSMDPLWIYVDVTPKAWASIIGELVLLLPLSYLLYTY